MNKIDSALEMVAWTARDLANRARVLGDADTAFAFAEIEIMLTGMALREESPLSRQIQVRLNKSGRRRGADYRRSRLTALALALFEKQYGLSGKKTSYSASKFAQELTGIDWEVIRKELEKIDDIPSFLASHEGRPVARIIDRLHGDGMGKLAQALDDLQDEANEYRDLDETLDVRRDRISKLINMTSSAPIDGAALLAYAALKDELWENAPMVTP
jgi:hypothetical protein